MVTIRPLAVITGASSGIGAEFARQLAARGYDLWLVARRANRLQALADELSHQYKIQTLPVAADLSVSDEVDELANRVGTAANLELLINNAGFGTKGYFFEASAESQDEMHLLHVMAPLKLSRAVLPALIERRKGGIINVASVAAFMSTPGNVSYCATKGWMVQFSEGLYLELRNAGLPVKVQALCPGFTYSEFHDAMGVDRKSVPDSLWLSAEFVVRVSLEGLDQGRFLVVPSWRYRLYPGLIRSSPDWLRHRIARWYGNRSRRHRSP